MERKLNEKIQKLHSEEIKSEDLSKDSRQDSEEKPLQSSWRSRFIITDDESIERFKANELKAKNSLFLLFNVYLLDSEHPVPLLFGTYLHFDQLYKGISYLESISLLVRDNLAVNHSYAISLCDILDYLDEHWVLSSKTLFEPFYDRPLVFDLLGSDDHKMIRLIKWCDSFEELKEFVKNEI